MNKKQVLAVVFTLMAAVGMAVGSITYSGPQNYTIAVGQAYLLDQDNDASIDFVITFLTGSQQKVYLDARTSENPNAWCLVKPATFGYPVTKFGTNIDAAYAAALVTNKIGFLNQATDANSTVVGDWSGSARTEGYVGTVFTDGTTFTNYGWVHLIYNGLVNPRTLTVVDYALETTSGKGIVAGATADVNVPVIYSQPQSTTNSGGSTAQFNVLALADPAPTYQWRAGSGGVYTNLPENGHFTGTTTPTLTINSVGLSDALDYIVIVSNSLATATSAPPAHLTLIAGTLTGPVPSQAQLFAGLNGSFGIQVSSVPTGFQWRKDGVNLTDGGKYPGLSSSNLVINALAPGDAGNYDVVVTTIYGNLTSSVAPLTLVFTNGDMMAAYTVTNGPLAYYRLNETGDPATATNLPAFDNISELNGTYLPHIQNGNPNYNVAGPRPADGFVGFPSTNTAARFTLNDTNARIQLPGWNVNTNTVTITAWINPNQAPVTGQGVVYTRSTNSMVCGLAWYGLTDWSLGYNWNDKTYLWNSGLKVPTNQWSFVALVITPTNGTVYLMNTNGMLSAVNAVTNAVQSLNDTIWIGTDPNATGTPGMRNFNGDIDDVAVFKRSLSKDDLSLMYARSLGLAGWAPVITQEPASRTNGRLSTATFTVIASATPSPAYQWRAGSGGVYTNLLEDSQFTGTTTPTLTVTSVGLSDARDYIVVVSNAVGSVTSAPPAHLTVVPAVLAGPLPPQAKLYLGLNGAFGIEVVSGAATGFQWRKDGVTLTDNVKYPGLATSNLVINVLGSGDAGNYDVVVATGFGNVTSSVAPLSLVTPDGSPYEAGVLAAGPAAYYRLNETGSPASGSLVAYDYVGGKNGLYGIGVVDNMAGPRSAVGFPGFVSTNTGGQLAANNTNSQIALLPWNLNTNTVTLTAWLNPAGNQVSGAGVIYTRGTNNVIGGLVYDGVQTNGDYTLGYNWNNNVAASGWSSGLSVPQNQWSLVALVITPTNATVYVLNTNFLKSSVNTTAHATMAWNGPEYLGTDPGGANGTRNFNGLLDEVGIFNKALTADQVLGLYGAGLNVAAIAPQITAQPLPQTVAATTTAHFTVAALGTAPLAYQWQFQSGGAGAYVNLSDVGNISGSTTPALAVANTSGADVGNYRVAVTNIMGAVTSSPAALGLTAPPPPDARLAFKFQPNQNSGRSFVNGPAGVLNTAHWININWPGASNVIPYTITGFNFELNGSTNGNPSTATLLSFQGGNGNQGNVTFGGSATPVAGFTNWNADLLNSSMRFDRNGAQGVQMQLACQVTNLDPVFATNGYDVYLYSLCGPNSPTAQTFSNSVSMGQQNILINYSGATTNTAVVTNQICSLYGTTNWNRWNAGDYLTNLPSFLQGTNIFVQGVWTDTPSTKDVYPAWETPGANYIVFHCPPSGAFSLIISNGYYAGYNGLEIVANNSGQAAVPTIGATVVSPANTVSQGTTVLLNAATNGGAPPFSLQWQTGPNGVTYTNLPGATSLPLTLGAVTAANAGYYQCVYSANGLSVTSAPALLTVITTAPVLGFTHGGGSLTLTWTSGMLLQATNVVGPWTTNTGAASPLIITPTGPRMFYRLLVP